MLHTPFSCMHHTLRSQSLFMCLFFLHRNWTLGKSLAVSLFLRLLHYACGDCMVGREEQEGKVKVPC